MLNRSLLLLLYESLYRGGHGRSAPLRGCAYRVRVSCSRNGVIECVWRYGRPLAYSAQSLGGRSLGASVHCVAFRVVSGAWCCKLQQINEWRGGCCTLPWFGLCAHGDGVCGSLVGARYDELVLQVEAGVSAQDGAGLREC